MAPTAAATASLPTLTQSGAQIALQAAEHHALEIGAPMSIAVVDAYTHLLSFTRMDGVKITSIKTAMDMAFTACGTHAATSAYREHSWPGSATNGIGNTNSGRFTTLSGGVPIISPFGDILGAIGCSNGTSMQNEAAAKAGRDAVLALIRKERNEEENRISEERAAVLKLWMEKEEEVGCLREQIEGLERGSKRIRLDGVQSRVGSVSGSMLGSRGSAIGNMIEVAAPDTPPEEGEIEVAAGRF